MLSLCICIQMGWLLSFCAARKQSRDSSPFIDFQNPKGFEIMPLLFKPQGLEATAWEISNKEDVFWKHSLSNSESICRLCTTCACFSQLLEQESSFYTHALPKGWEAADRGLMDCAHPQLIGQSCAIAQKGAKAWVRNPPLLKGKSTKKFRYYGISISQTHTLPSKKKKRWNGNGIFPYITYWCIPGNSNQKLQHGNVHLPQGK